MKILVCLLIFFLTIRIFAQTEPIDTDGDGYRNIETLQNLRWISENSKSWNWNFELDNDIDASETIYWNVGDHDCNSNTPDSAKGWNPIGNFKGTFDGKGHFIQNLYINSMCTDLCQSGGFFGTISDGALVSNLNIINANITTICGTAGLFCARIYSNSALVRVQNCFASGNVYSGYGTSGGFCGSITAYFSGSNVKVQNCSSQGNINGTSDIGGFCGVSYLYDGNILIENCCSKGNVYSKGINSKNAGGFCGYMYAYSGYQKSNKILNCFSNSNVEGVSNVGGFCGQMVVSFWYSKTEIINCYSTGKVSGNSNLGGLNGIKNNQGGIINISNSFWDKDKSEISYSSGGIGKTTSEMFQKSTYTTWDFTNLWEISQNDYPYLKNSFCCGIQPLPIPISWQNNDSSNTKAYIFLNTNIKPLFKNRAFRLGDGIGIFYKADKEKICSGYGIWNGNNLKIQIWGDNPITIIKDGFLHNETFFFKIWDCVKGDEFDAFATYLSGPNNFQNDSVSVIGSLEEINNDKISFFLNTGWNLISSNITPASPDSMQYIWAYNTDKLVITKNNAGSVYIPQFGINSIGKWDVTQGYQVYMSAADTLGITGEPVVPSETGIALKSGWNMIAYLRNSSMEAPLAFASITDNGNLVIAKNISGQVYIPSFGINSIGNLVPGQGYRVYVTNNDTLLYPDN